RTTCVCSTRPRKSAARRERCGARICTRAGRSRCAASESGARVTARDEREEVVAVALAVALDRFGDDVLGGGLWIFAAARGPVGDAHERVGAIEAALGLGRHAVVEERERAVGERALERAQRRRQPLGGRRQWLAERDLVQRARA